ncbi:MAG: prolyl-tRNA synthetase associated domain-containing protein [Eubacterium sp.]|nr:prolyl-tRNA synthetase associated domain-containing protein [Eubacterium sp.]
MIGKKEIYNILADRGIWHIITDHPALWSMSDTCDVEFPYPECDAKNLFLREKKHKNFYLVTVRGDKRVDLKRFRDENGTRALTFGSPEELEQLFSVIPGMVSPFGLLNDKDCCVRFYIDEDFYKEPGYIAVHPNDNTATVTLRTEDLTQIIAEHGTEIKTVTIPEKAKDSSSEAAEH